MLFFLGKDCDVDIDDCASNPCVNGGECVDQVNTYRCICPVGYTGYQCEVSCIILLWWSSKQFEGVFKSSNINFYSHSIKFLKVSFIANDKQTGIWKPYINSRTLDFLKIINTPALNI